ncbi:MAG: HEAT repeat domain-containing protein [Planctomycetaceae bacterium]|nr:HEAT repeat domain-containing protein [Planctomycetaceae bacterium]
MILLTGVIVGLCIFVGKEYFPSFLSPEITKNTENNKNTQISKNDHPLPLIENNEIEAKTPVAKAYQIDDSKIHATYLTAQTIDKPRPVEEQFLEKTPPKLPQEFPLQKDNLTSLPRVGFYSLQRPSEFSIREKPQELIARQAPMRSLPQNHSDISPFLDSRLQTAAIQDLPQLPTQDLMRLLNHTDSEISQQSEEILKTRDCFEDEQVRLAAMLYHPNSNIRKSLLPALASDEQLETSNWLIELLKDPDDDVRWTTARVICSQQSFSLDSTSLEHLKEMIQADANTKIAALAQQIESIASAKREDATR